jgi:hypothetical protein
MENRLMYQYVSQNNNVYITDFGKEHYISTAMPIIAEGDVIGCVISGWQDNSVNEKISSEIEAKLIQTAGIFLGKQMEN